MSGLGSKLRYPLFGLLVLVLYGWTVQQGREPFEVSSNKRVATRQASAHGSGYRRGPSIWFWGFGGK